MLGSSSRGVAGASADAAPKQEPWLPRPGVAVSAAQMTDAAVGPDKPWAPGQINPRLAPQPEVAVKAPPPVAPAQPSGVRATSPVPARNGGPMARAAATRVTPVLEQGYLRGSGSEEGEIPWNTPESDAPLCPRCQVPMKIRWARAGGNFWGCPYYAQGNRGCHLTRRPWERRG